jgi:hypothetical protein
MVKIVVEIVLESVEHDVNFSMLELLQLSLTYIFSFFPQDCRLGCQSELSSLDLGQSHNGFFVF